MLYELKKNGRKTEKKTVSFLVLEKKFLDVIKTLKIKLHTSCLIDMHISYKVFEVTVNNAS